MYSTYLFVVMAMWWYDTFYILLSYVYILIDRCLSFNLYPTPQGCVQSTDLLPAVVALSVVLTIVVLLLVVTILNIGLLHTSESVMLEYVHCMCKHVCVFV